MGYAESMDTTPSVKSSKGASTSNSDLPSREFIDKAIVSFRNRLRSRVATAREVIRPYAWRYTNLFIIIIFTPGVRN